MQHHRPSKKKSTAFRRKLVPCDVGGRSQTWISTARVSGILSIWQLEEPVPSTLDRLLGTMNSVKPS